MKLVSRVNSLELPYQVHLLALSALAVCLLLSWAFPTSNATQQALLLFASLGFGIGFVLWCRPTVIRAWAHPLGRVAISIAHVFVLLLAVVFARFIVASALELPPQDFDLTVSLLSLILYVPAWSLIVTLVLGVVAIVLELVGLLGGFLGRPASESAKMFVHMAGALSVCFLVGSIFDVVAKNERTLHPMVRWIAFVSDFQASPKYPGVGANERIRLHENGVISFARVQDGEVVIDVRRHEQ
ncbi:hypothetical protein [Ideonella sp. BN130291]|uniref:hypothetical protein n=1 Tax=Ideonella sp. BN130291 TaxID=3112940 RepID=UPI002E2730C7|nr:hypothetical protein [Ideonella sp. BN130291]